MRSFLLKTKLIEALLSFFPMRVVPKKGYFSWGEKYKQLNEDSPKPNQNYLPVSLTKITGRGFLPATRTYLSGFQLCLISSFRNSLKIRIELIQERLELRKSEKQYIPNIHQKEPTTFLLEIFPIYLIV